MWSESQICPIDKICQNMYFTWRNHSRTPIAIFCCEPFFLKFNRNETRPTSTENILET